MVLIYHVGADGQHGAVACSAFRLIIILLMKFPPMGPFMTELFPTAVRGTAQGFCYNAGRAIGSFFPTMVGFVSQVLPLGATIAVFSAIASGIDDRDAAAAARNPRPQPGKLGGGHRRRSGCAANGARPARRPPAERRLFRSPGPRSGAGWTSRPDAASCAPAFSARDSGGARPGERRWAPAQASAPTAPGTMSRAPKGGKCCGSSPRPSTR